MKWTNYEIFGCLETLSLYCSSPWAIRIPIDIMLEVPSQYIVINKPGSIPVHSKGRYYRHSVIGTYWRTSLATLNYLVVASLISVQSYLKHINKCKSSTASNNLHLAWWLSPQPQNVLGPSPILHDLERIHNKYVARCKGEIPGAVSVTCCFLMLSNLFLKFFREAVTHTELLLTVDH
jgi:hypothetical protein